MPNHTTELGVNIDHVATVRQARRTYEPDPVWAASEAILGGADAITFHLREDRRHIQDRDVELLCQTVPVRKNMELACADEVLAIACRLKPEWALLVPESREEVTTEGGLNVAGDTERVRHAIDRLKNAGIKVSLFLDPDQRQLEASLEVGADAVELHTGPYALATDDAADRELQRLVTAGRFLVDHSVHLHAGHGLNYQNVRPVAAIPAMRELNIGHAIVSRAVFVGMREAVRQMKESIQIAC